MDFEHNEKTDDAINRGIIPKSDEENKSSGSGRENLILPMITNGQNTKLSNTYQTEAQDIQEEKIRVEFPEIKKLVDLENESSLMNLNKLPNLKSEDKNREISSKLYEKNQLKSNPKLMYLENANKQFDQEVLLQELEELERIAQNSQKVDEKQLKHANNLNVRVFEGFGIGFPRSVEHTVSSLAKRVQKKGAISANRQQSSHPRLKTERSFTPNPRNIPAPTSTKKPVPHSQPKKPPQKPKNMLLGPSTRNQEKIKDNGFLTERNKSKPKRPEDLKQNLNSARERRIINSVRNNESERSGEKSQPEVTSWEVGRVYSKNTKTEPDSEIAPVDQNMELNYLNYLHFQNEIARLREEMKSNSNRIQDLLSEFKVLVTNNNTSNTNQEKQIDPEKIKADILDALEKQKKNQVVYEIMMKQPPITDPINMVTEFIGSENFLQDSVQKEINLPIHSSKSDDQENLLDFDQDNLKNRIKGQKVEKANTDLPKTAKERGFAQKKFIVNSKIEEKKLGNIEPLTKSSKNTESDFSFPDQNLGIKSVKSANMKEVKSLVSRAKRNSHEIIPSNHNESQDNIPEEIDQSTHDRPKDSETVYSVSPMRLKPLSRNTFSKERKNKFVGRKSNSKSPLKSKILSPIQREDRFKGNSIIKSKYENGQGLSESNSLKSRSIENFNSQEKYQTKTTSQSPKEIKKFNYPASRSNKNINDSDLKSHLLSSFNVENKKSISITKPKLDMNFATRSVAVQAEIILNDTKFENVTSEHDMVGFESKQNNIDEKRKRVPFKLDSPKVATKPRPIPENSSIGVSTQELHMYETLSDNIQRNSIAVQAEEYENNTRQSFFDKKIGERFSHNISAYNNNVEKALNHTYNSIGIQAEPTRNYNNIYFIQEMENSNYKLNFTKAPKTTYRARNYGKPKTYEDGQFTEKIRKKSLRILPRNRGVKRKRNEHLPDWLLSRKPTPNIK